MGAGGVESDWDILAHNEAPRVLGYGGKYEGIKNRRSRLARIGSGGS